LYQPRLYRGEMNAERFRFFPSVYRESDLLLGVPRTDYHAGMAGICRREQLRLYRLLSAHVEKHPDFFRSLESLSPPVTGESLAPELETMYRCGQKTGTGPMSSVAGLFAERVADALASVYEPGELLVENGGDLHLRTRDEVITVIHAGNSPLSGQLGLVIPPGTWGICTSSGTQGHSYSMGRADALTVVSRDTALADAWATALANRVHTEEDIDPLLESVSGITDIAACVVIVGEKVGIRGGIELKLLS
jgi:ApbE superfamily uncharacterized protein (UPF0280 family)